MFKRRKERKALKLKAEEDKRVAEETEIENGLELLITRAGQITDPIEKIEELGRVKDRISKITVLTVMAVATREHKSTEIIFKEDRHVKKLMDHLRRTDGLLSGVIEDNVEKIALSPARQELLKIDGFAEKFARAAANNLANAAAKKLAAEKEASAEAALPPETEEPETGQTPKTTRLRIQKQPAAGQ